MDEPLSNLDAKLRVQMRTEIAQIQRRLAGDHHLRDPRPGRGDDHGRPRRADAGRRPAAGRYAHQHLPEAGKHLRCLLHRLALDEPLPGLADARRRRRRAAPRHASPPRSRRDLRGAGRTREKGRRRDHRRHPAGRSWRMRHSSPTTPRRSGCAVPVVLTESLGSDQMVHFSVDAPVAKVADRDLLDEIVIGDAASVCIGRFGARSTAQTRADHRGRRRLRPAAFLRRRQGARDLTEREEREPRERTRQGARTSMRKTKKGGLK